MKFEIFKRHINFKDQVFKSSKSILKHLYSICMNDNNSETGKKLRMIMLFCNLSLLSNLDSSTIDKLIYSEIPITEKWRIKFTDE